MAGAIPVGPGAARLPPRAHHDPRSELAPAQLRTHPRPDPGGALATQRTVRRLTQMKFTNTITINRQPAAVFRFLAHFENVPRWNYAISETRKITGGPVGVGSRYQQTRTLPTPSVETSR